MKRIILLAGVLVSFAAQAQFTSTDSLHRYNDRYVGNDAISAFRNLRLNTLLHGIIDFLDSAGGPGSSFVDSIYAVNDSIARYKKAGVSIDFKIKGVYDLRRKVDSVFALNDTVIRFKINGTNRDVLVRGPDIHKINDSLLYVKGDTIRVGGTGVGGSPIIAGRNLIKSADTLSLKDSITLSLASFQNGASDSAYIGLDNKSDLKYVNKLELANVIASLPPPSIQLDSNRTLIYVDGPFGQVLTVNLDTFYTKPQTDHLLDSVRQIRDPLAMDTAKKIADSIEFTKVNGVKWKIKDDAGTGLPPGITIDSIPMGNSPSQLPTSEAVRAYVDAKVIGSSTGDFVRITIAGLDVSDTLNTNKVYWLTDSLKQGPVVFTKKMSNGQATDNGVTVFVTADSNQYIRAMRNGRIDARWAGLTEGTDGTSQTNNVLALRKLRDISGNNEVQYVPHGNYYLNDTVWYYGVLNGKTNNFVSEGNFYFSNHNGFRIEGRAEQLFKFNDINGQNANATDSAGYNAYTTGYGLDLVNLYNSRIEFHDILNFREGIRLSGQTYAGNPIGSAPEGSQMNTITGNWVHHNRINVHITTIGTPSPAGTGNYANESIWDIRQIGRGQPAGAGGWWGLKIDKTSGNAPTYGISGHNFKDVQFEGNQIAIQMDYSDFNLFSGGSIEAFTNTYHWVVADTTCNGNRLIGVSSLLDSYFKTGQMGNMTYASGVPVWAVDSTNSALQTFSAMEGHSVPINGKQFFFRKSIAYNGYTDWYLRTQNQLAEIAQFPFVYKGMVKIFGKTRLGAYGTQSNSISDSWVDGDVLKPNTGYIQSTNSTDKIAKWDADDLGAGYIPHPVIVEKTGAGNLVLQRSDNAGSIFTFLGSTGAGTYILSFRNNGWKSTQISGTGTGGGITDAFYDTDPTVWTSYGDGTGVSGGVARLGYAENANPGGLGPYEQYIKNGKIFDSVAANGFTFMDSMQTSGPGGRKKINPITLRKFTNGISNDPNGVPNPTDASAFKWNISSYYTGRDLIFGFGKAAANYTWVGNNGQIMIFGNEKSSGTVFDFRANTAYNTLTTASGTSLFQISATGILKWPLYAGSTTRMVTVAADGTIGSQTIPSGTGGGSAYPWRKAPDSVGVNNDDKPVKFGVYGNPTAYFDLRGSSTTFAALVLQAGLILSPKQLALEHDALGFFYNTRMDNIRRKLLEEPPTGSALQYIRRNAANTDIEYADIPGATAFDAATITGSVVSGAGTGATITVPSYNRPRAIDFRMLGGTGAGTNAQIATLTFSVALPTNALLMITPANSVAAARPLYAQTSGSNTIAIYVGPTALQSGASHIYSMQVVYP